MIRKEDIWDNPDLDIDEILDGLDDAGDLISDGLQMAVDGIHQATNAIMRNGAIYHDSTRDDLLDALKRVASYRSGIQVELGDILMSISIAKKNPPA